MSRWLFSGAVSFTSSTPSTPFPPISPDALIQNALSTDAVPTHRGRKVLREGVDGSRRWRPILSVVEQVVNSVVARVINQRRKPAGGRRLNGAYNVINGEFTSVQRESGDARRKCSLNVRGRRPTSVYGQMRCDY